MIRSIVPGCGRTGVRTRHGRHESCLQALPSRNAEVQQHLPWLKVGADASQPKTKPKKETVQAAEEIDQPVAEVRKMRRAKGVATFRTNAGSILT